MLLTKLKKKTLWFKLGKSLRDMQLHLYVHKWNYKHDFITSILKIDQYFYISLISETPHPQDLH